MIEIYTCDSCNPCVEATEWMTQRGIKYVQKGMVSHITEYPTFIVDGKTIIGWGEEAKQAIIGGE